MKVLRHADPRSFLDRAGPWLLRAEVENNLILGLTARLIPKPPSPDAEAPYLATVEEGGEVVACAFRRPPHKAIITRASPAALDCLVEDMADRYPTLPVVLGPEPDVRGFAERWSRRQGTQARRGSEERVFSIRQVKPLERRPAGGMRVVRADDVPTLSAWIVGFSEAVGGLGVSDPDGFAREGVEDGSMFVWENGHPVSMAYATGRTPTGMRVSLVYTPPEHRGRGYASACVADLTQRLLDQGCAYCCLFTDLANPTSNKIYQVIGYQPVLDMTDYLLDGVDASRSAQVHT